MLWFSGRDEQPDFKTAEEKMEQQIDLENALEEYADKEALKAPEKYLECLGRLAASIVNIPSFQRRYARTAMDQAIRAYFSQQISAKYQRISKTMLALKRTIKLQKERSEYEAEIPVFACAQITDDEWTLKTKTNPKQEAYEYELSLSARLPAMPLAVMEKVKQADMFMCQLYAKALQTPIGDQLVFYPRHTPNPLFFDFNVLWIPNPTSINFTVREPERKNRDPAVVIDWENWLYLVAKWNVDHEEPFAHYLSEYSI